MLHDEDNSELDDTHLCIKCGTTVEGIENYIKHRKVNCSQTQQSPKSAVVPSVTSGRPEPERADPEPTGAEELRVTTVPPSSYGTFDFSEAIKEPDHHKKVPSSAYDYHNYELQPQPHHHHHHHDHDEDHQHQQQHQQQQQQDEPEHPGAGADGKTADYKNEVNYEYELGADLFFSSLELQSSSKKSERAPGSATGPKRQVRLRKPPGSVSDTQQQQLPDDWLATSASSSDKLMKAVSDISGHKKPMDLYPIFHQESPEPPTDDDEAVSEEEDDDDEDAPPRTHTGGKWKPENRPSGSLLQRSAHHWRHQWLHPEPDEPETTSCKSFSPPPPGHTKGKWVPGSKQTPRLEEKPRVQVGQYEDQCWCSICNRRLASRAVYERHLKSQLHLKRAQEESELERTAVRPLYSAEQLSKQLQESRQQSSSQADQLSRRTPAEGAKAKRKRKCYYAKCGVCKTRLPTHLLGKHLISRYHYRRMQNHPQQCWELVLRNMHRIVLQSPFQCQPCRFYANTEPHFMRHWTSDEHRDTVGAPDGKFWCSFCKFECDGNQQMTEHLLGAGHRELIAVINRSVPIIIRRLADIRCACCGLQFRYNAELRRHQRLHCSATGPEQAAQVCSRVQNTFVCELCGASFPDRIRLLQHGQKLHRLAHYYCSICECSFGTARESLRHRRTTRHKTMSARRRQKGQRTPKGCSVCKVQLADILELKQHMHEAHPDVKYSCPGCGECFVLAQELGRHVRDKNCTFFNSSTSSATATPRPATIDSAATTHQPAAGDGALPVVARTPATLPASPSSASSSSATRSHLPVTNSIISNDSIKVNMNDRKLGKEPHLYSSSASDQQQPVPVRAPVAGEPGPADEPRSKATTPAPPSNSDCDNTPDVAGARGSPPATGPAASAEIFLTMAANIASENNTVYVDEIVGTIAPDGSLVCWQCKICPFSTSSQAEFLFHEILHSSKLDDKAKSSRRAPPPKLVCPLCGRPFSKASLRCHLRQHTNERLFPCPHCPMAFTRKTNLKSHTDNIHRKPPIGPTDPGGPVEDPATRHICTTCGKTFANRHIMLQHSKVHHQQRSIKQFACQHEGCHYLAGTAAMARRHQLVHSDQRHFACGEGGCDYRGKTLASLRRHALRHEDTDKKYKCDQCEFACRLPGSLKRHLLVHSGQKPFSCPHCDYTCNAIENLRKHVISTARHLGRFLYECKICAHEAAEGAYGTNFQKEYKTHLQECHKMVAEQVEEMVKL
ncbi:uncharacterized protein LOC131207801 [Anopheles bellator]|uniref:uncharacterized protein LOC131207801 n=1 Tax=Anopheles bellator TaxID=139047 RepID=UPI002649592D|nr:uncharacterized protein LOC131207801 [Anopheles bellator]